MSSFDWKKSIEYFIEDGLILTASIRILLPLDYVFLHGEEQLKKKGKEQVYEQDKEEVK